MVGTVWRRFNGAADLHPRKWIHQQWECLFMLMASMGPRTYIRGNGKSEPGLRGAEARFNGAADLHPRKCPGRPRKETKNPPASMGPRTYIRGNSNPGLRFEIVLLASMGPRTY